MDQMSSPTLHFHFGVSVALLFYEWQCEEGDSLIGLVYYYQPSWIKPFTAGHWLLIIDWETFLRSDDYLASVRGHFYAKSRTALLSWPEGGSCVKIKGEGMTTMTDIPIFYLLGLMLLVNKMRQIKHVGVIFLDQLCLIQKYWLALHKMCSMIIRTPPNILYYGTP